MYALLIQWHLQYNMYSLLNGIIAGWTELLSPRFGLIVVDLHGNIRIEYISFPYKIERKD